MGKTHISPEMRYEKECAVVCLKEIKKLMSELECGVVSEEFHGQYDFLLEEAKYLGERIQEINTGKDLYEGFRNQPDFYPPKKAA